MKIILAPDKFKGNMTSPEVCSIIRDAFAAEIPDAEILSIPMADGGEGTTDAVIAANHGELRKVKVTGPLGVPVEAVYGIYDSGRAAVMEMSSASGLALLKTEELNPLRATTYGTGELIKAALDAGAKDLTIGIGGSATVDGGTGMARALGFRFLDCNGKELPPYPEALTALERIEVSQADPRLQQVRIHVACDVTNPLLGENGSAVVYGPQKGATPEMVDTLERCLKKLSEVWIRQEMLTSTSAPGDGAAGGLGAGLRAFCHAVPTSGAKLIIKVTELEKYLPDCDLLITGEGCTDGQTEAGKLCSEVADTAHRYAVPVLLLSGALKGNIESLGNTFDFAFSTSTGAHGSIAETIKAGRRDLGFTARQLARIFKKGVH